MDQQQMFFDKDEVIRRLLIMAEAINKMPDFVKINFNFNIGVLDKRVNEVLMEMNEHCNSSYAPSYKLQTLDDASNILKSLGLDGGRPEIRPPKPPKPTNAPNLNPNRISFSSEDQGPPPLPPEPPKPKFPPHEM